MLLEVVEDAQGLKIIKRAKDRWADKMPLYAAAGALGVPSVFVVWGAWSFGPNIDWKWMSLGLLLCGVSAALGWKAARLGDEVWRFDSALKVVTRDGKRMCSFDQLRAVRCRPTHGGNGSFFELALSGHQGRSFRDLYIAHSTGLRAEHERYEHVARRIAEVARVRLAACS